MHEWPDLPWHEWEPTLSTVHRWLQVVGRVRMVLSPRQPHWGHVPLRVAERGFTTGSIPHPDGAFRIDVDLVDHRLAIVRGARYLFVLPLGPMSVAAFYRQLLGALAAIGIDVSIPTAPPEDPTGTPLDLDEEHATYVPEHAVAVWRGFATADRLLRTFGAAHRDWTEPGLFWGSLDLAISRYSDEPPSEQTGGWWATSGQIGPAFYAYTKPEPPGYRLAPLEPAGARFDDGFGEFILTEGDARAAPDRDRAALA